MQASFVPETNVILHHTLETRTKMDGLETRRASQSLIAGSVMQQIHEDGDKMKL